MKKKLILPLFVLSLFALTGCITVSNSQSTSSDTNSSSTTSIEMTPSETTSNDITTSQTTSSDTSEEITSIIPADLTDVSSVEEYSIDDDETSGTFSLVDESNNAVSSSSGIYTISSGGTYTAKGVLDGGQIYVNAADEDVEIVLNNASITNDSNAPIYVVTANEVKLKAKKDSLNYIYDKRTTDYSQSTSEATAAIYANDGDLDFAGQGTLYVYSYQNSGIHSKDNVSVKNLTLFVRAQNNGIKGNDKVTFKENPYVDIYADNNGVITSNSEVGSSAQHGYININGGTLLVNSNGDGIDAAYSVEVGTSTDNDGVIYTPTVRVYTGKYSSFYSSNVSSTVSYAFGRPGPSGGMGPGGNTSGNSSADKDADTAKGIKAANAINVTAGDIYVQTYDDGIHVDDDTLDSGSKGSGTFTISGGVVNVYASDDGIHTEGALNISGGTVNILASHEGIEGKTITVSGGAVKVSPVYTTDSYGVKIATDDAINASSALIVTGGYIDASVNPNGDYDCLDSNGSFTMSGGVVVARGPNSGMAGAIDCDGAIKVTGGTLIYCGSLEGGSKSITTTSRSLSLHSSGSQTINVNGTSYTFTNSYSYRSTTCYSNVSVSK